ncbi:MAG: polysaccharide biosynthesis tyrosine autokinase [Deltaproteobacteria bacterium]|nr:polysaccharide biosynthesis tyrosine autokinase [Deltaproteobacteria bacterium]
MGIQQHGGELVSVGASDLGPARTPRSVEYIEAEYSEPSRRSLREYLWVLYKYRWLGTVCFAATLGITLVVTLLSSRVYTSATRILVSREGSIQLQLEEDILNLDHPDRNVNGASSFLATQVAILKSRDLAERVIRRQHLAENEMFLHPAAERRGLFAVGAGLVGAVRPRGLSGAAPRASRESKSSVNEVSPRLLDRYMGYLSVKDVRGTDLIEVAFTTPNPSLSAFLAAAHTQAYLESAEETKVATDVQASQFLDRQIRQSRQQVERTEASLAKFAGEHLNVAVNQEQKVIGQRISQAAASFTEAEARRIHLQSRYEFLTQKELDPLPYFLGGDAEEGDEEGIQRLHLSLVDLQIQRTALEDRLGPKHPQIIELNRQAGETQQQLFLELQRQVAAVRARYEAAQLREDRMRKKLGDLEESAIGLQSLGARYELLKTDVENARSLHESLLKQQIETAVHSDLGASNVRIIERAEVPELPSKPNVPFNLTFGALAGVLVAVGAVVACERFDDSVKTSKEIEGLLNLPPLATIRNFGASRTSGRRALGSGRGERGRIEGGSAVEPGDPTGPRPELVVLHEPWSVVAEAFRGLRTSVLFSTPETPPKVILVTSAGMGEGKTIVSTNLTATLAEAGSRVLLIDGDMRHPSCHPMLGLKNDRGLSSFLAGQVTLEEAMQPLDRPRITFVAAGPTPPNPAELLASSRMHDAITLLRDQYDFIIIDSPPVIPVTDGVVMSRDADGVVLVVKGHDTPREMVKRARDNLRVANAHLLGVVINNVNLGFGDLFYYDQYYGYYNTPGHSLDSPEVRA